MADNREQALLDKRRELLNRQFASGILGATYYIDQLNDIEQQQAALNTWHNNNKGEAT